MTDFKKKFEQNDKTFLVRIPRLGQMANFCIFVKYGPNIIWIKRGLFLKMTTTSDTRLFKSRTGLGSENTDEIASDEYYR